MKDKNSFVLVNRTLVTTASCGRSLLLLLFLLAASGTPAAFAQGADD